MSVLIGGLTGSSSRLAAGIGVGGLGSLCFVSDVMPQSIQQARGLSALGPRVGKFRKTLSGTTHDSADAALPAATVHCFQTATDLEVDQVDSDANGQWEVSQYADVGLHYCVSYKAGTPDVAGTTLNTLSFE